MPTDFPPPRAWIIYTIILCSSIKPGINHKVIEQEDIPRGAARLRYDSKVRLFQDNTHPSYEVIYSKVSITRNKRSVDSKTMSLELPIGNDSVKIQLQQVDIAHPKLKVRLNDQIQKTIIQRDCYFCGCEEETCAVVSTCDGLTGIIEQSSDVYQMQEVSESDIEAVPDSPRTRRDASERTIVIWKLHVNLKEGNKYIPLPEAPTYSDFNDYAKENLHKEFEILEEDLFHGPRVRRRIDGPYTVELAVFVDHHYSRYIAKRYPGANVVDKIQDIVLTLMNAVHRMYDTAALGDSRLGIMVKEIDIETEDDKKHKDHDGDIYKYLSSFCFWQAARNPRGKSGEWDHALLLSGLDLWNLQKQQNSTVGLAYVGGMCSTSYSCTVNEGTTLAAAYIIAHEMGHNLGMRHDGDQGLASSCPKSKYLMSPVMSSGAATWSSCSKLALENFLSKKGSCLKSSRGMTSKSADHHGLSPGERYEADEQCHFMYGTGWNHFSNTEDPFNNVCKEIWCRKGRHLRTPTAPALEGTSCGQNKVCHLGRCRQISNQSSKNKKIKKKDKNDKNKKNKKDKKDRKKKKKNEKRKLKEIFKEITKVSKDILDKKPKKGKAIKLDKKDLKNGLKNRNDITTKINEKTKTLSKTKKKKNSPKKIRRIENARFIIIKERLEYIKDKGWKLKIIKIKKTAQMKKKWRKKLKENRKNETEDERNIRLEKQKKRKKKKKKKKRRKKKIKSR